MAATSPALAAGLTIAIPAKPIRNAKKTASDLRPLRALIVFNFPSFVTALYATSRISIDLHFQELPEVDIN